MSSLHELLVSQVREQLSFPNLGARLIDKRLAEVGVSLNDEQLREVESKLLNLTGDSITISVDVDEMPSADDAWEHGIQETLRIDLSDSEEDLAALVQRFGEGLQEAIPAIVDKVSEMMLDQLKRDAPEMLSRRKKQRQSFEADLAKLWRRPLQLLEMIVAIAYEAGDEFNRECRTQPSQGNDCKLEVLTRLHARACQIASEVLVLLRAGCADGAHARWRSLHEIAVVAFLIACNGEEIAERYLLYEVVESYDGAKKHQEHCDALGFEPIADEEFSEIELSYQRLKARFGDSYVKPHGWAAPAFGGKAPRFVDLEEKVGLAHLRPFYKMACHNVHAGAKGAFFRLGLYPASEPVLLAGPSDTGLADPAQGMAISLGQITSTVLNARPSVDSLVVSTVLMKLADEVGRESVDVQSALEAHAASQRSLQ